MTSKNKMRTAVFSSPGRVEIDLAPIPEPGAGEVRVRLEGCGVCGSNLSVWEGRPWFQYPQEAGAPGHEGWGVVDAVGDDVGDFIRGQRVSMISYHSFAEYDMAPATSLIPLPKTLGRAPCPGKPLGCAMNVFERSGIRAGQTVAVVGIGVLGALLTSLASQSGARVVAISRRPFARQMAHRLGASEVLSLADHWRVIQQVKEMTAGQGCDVVVEATGFQGPLDLAGELARERGRLVIAGYHHDGPRQVDLQLWNWRGLDVINAHERDGRRSVEGTQAAFDAVADGRLDALPLFTHSYPLEHVAEAFVAMRNRTDGFLKGYVTFA